MSKPQVSNVFFIKYTTGTSPVVYLCKTGMKIKLKEKCIEMTEEEIEAWISSQKSAVKLKQSNVFEYLIYKIAFARAERNLYLAEKNILLSHLQKKNKYRRLSLP